MKSAPCRNCPDRNPGCHDICAEYQEFKKERSDIRKKRNEINDIYYMDKDLKIRCSDIVKRKNRR